MCSETGALIEQITLVGSTAGCIKARQKYPDWEQIKSGPKFKDGRVQHFIIIQREKPIS